MVSYLLIISAFAWRGILTWSLMVMSKAIIELQAEYIKDKEILIADVIKELKAKGKIH